MPVSRVAEFVIRATAAVAQRLPGIRPIAFGHVGDGNIHFNLTQPEGADTTTYLGRWQEFNDIVHGVVRDLHGSISAEQFLALQQHIRAVRRQSEVERYLLAIVRATRDHAAVQLGVSPRGTLALYPAWCAFALALSAHIWLLNRRRRIDVS